MLLELGSMALDITRVGIIHVINSFTGIFYWTVIMLFCPCYVVK